jgi:hypothetical protein
MSVRCNEERKRTTNRERAKPSFFRFSLSAYVSPAVYPQRLTSNKVAAQH